MTDRQLQLLDLPNEIISHILRCLDSPAPSLQDNIQQPKPIRTNVKSSTLKKASLLSRRLRRLALPYLFQHVHINPSHLKSLLKFLTSSKLDYHVETVVAYLPSPCSHYHPPWWFSILAQLTKLRTLTVIAPPHIFSEVTKTNARSRDIWAFNMPYQTLQLRYDRPVNEAAPIQSQDSPSGDHILLARPWTSVLINEGSSLKAYTTWEHWLRVTPSPIYALDDRRRFKDFISNLRSFSLVSIFPIYAHVANALDLIKQMHHLQSLFIKLIPEPDSTVLDDEIEEAKGHLDVNDPWSEFDTSLALTAVACLYLSERKEDEYNDWGLPRLGELRELRVDDIKMKGVRENIEQTVSQGLVDRPRLGWSYDGDGVWTRAIRRKDAD